MSFEVSLQKKVAFSVAGLVFILVMATPQTPDTLRRYLSEKGYADVRVDDRFTNCGKGRRQFDFRARTADGRPVNGHVCMSDLGRYTLTLHSN